MKSFDNNVFIDLPEYVENQSKRIIKPNDTEFHMTLFKLYDGEFEAAKINTRINRVRNIIGGFCLDLTFLDFDMNDKLNCTADLKNGFLSNFENDFIIKMPGQNKKINRVETGYLKTKGDEYDDFLIDVYRSIELEKPKNINKSYIDF